jgi:tetratricopeptide (TPR) repeat protein
MEKAETAYAAALKAVPGYHLALAGQAQVFGARGKLAEAVQAYQASLKQVERPDWMAAMGDLYLAMGQREQAEAQYVAVEEYLARHMDDPIADATHQLAQFLADRGRKPAQALALARQEAANAQDIKANDTLAWALYHGGHYAEAWGAAQKALRLGTRDPKLLYHAGMIAGRLPAHRKEGEQLLRRALALNPKWDVLDAPAAQRALEAMTTG